MKLHYVNILMPLCIAGLVTLGVVALERDGFVRFRFGDGEMVIDGRHSAESLSGLSEVSAVDTAGERNDPSPIISP